MLLKDGHRLVFCKKLVKINPWKVVNLRSNAISTKSRRAVQVKMEPSKLFVTNDFEEAWIDSSDSMITNMPTVVKTSNDVIVYMCSICKMCFPLKQMLEEHKVKVHGSLSLKIKSKTSCTEERRIFHIGYHKISSGEFVCNLCPFHSFERTVISSHVACKHASFLQRSNGIQIFDKKLEDDNDDVKIETLEDDENTWPMEVVVEPENNKSDTENTSNKTRICPHCSFATINSSTFYSHIKRKHRDNYITVLDKKIGKLESAKELNKCSHCPYVTQKRTNLRTHIIQKHKLLFKENPNNTENVEDKMKEESSKKQNTNEAYQENLKDFQDLEDIVILNSMRDMYSIQDEVEELVNMDDTVTTKTNTTALQESRKCPYCPFESLIRSTTQSHISRCHLSSTATRPRNFELPTMTGGRKLSNAQLYTGYACHYCTFAAATVASINSHTAREHQEQKQPIKEVPVTEYDCDQCDYKSKNRRNMQLHLKRCHTAQANAEGMFSCHACSYETMSRMGLKRHISIKHNKSRKNDSVNGNYHVCDQCDFKCLNGKTMDWHKRQHNAPLNAEDEGSSYFCNDCDFSTWTKGQLYLHIKRKHRDTEGNSKDTELEQTDNIFACEQCDYTSKNKHVMKVHVIRKHTNDYNHECEICGKKYKIKADLTNHIRFQHREQPIICDVCGKTCRNSNLLYLHQKFAHYKPEFECPICHRRMVSQVNLDDHILKQHEQREDAVCEECGKKFTKQARLKIHMRIHTGIKPYTCKVCLKAFARRNGLRQHLLIHTGQKPYICDICGKSFTQKTGLICHRKSHPGSHPPLPRVTIDHVLSDLLNDEC